MRNISSKVDTARMELSGQKSSQISLTTENDVENIAITTNPTPQEHSNIK